MESSTTLGLRETWRESLQLLKELDPDIALTHQQQPLLYKRQQILALASHLEGDMKQLDVILKLLLTGTSKSSSGEGALRLDQVTQAPIVSSYRPITPHDQQRVEQLRVQYAELHRRIARLQQQFQHLLESYHTCMTAMSEKFILVQEEL
jgi:hypothetical protein